MSIMRMEMALHAMDTGAIPKLQLIDSSTLIAPGVAAIEGGICQVSLLLPELI
jgi:hypothetical protein